MPASTVADVDERHWWVQARRHVVADVLRRQLPPAPARRIFDAGGGTGPLASVLGEFGTVSGERPAAGEADVVAAFDILEGAPDERGMLADLHRALRPGGTLVLTVAGFEFLWGPHDDLSRHRRRYGRGELRRRLADAGFAVDLVNYFGAWLFPAASARAIVRRFRGWDEPRPDFVARSAPVNRAFTWLAVSEAPLVARWSLPAGVALVAVARKP
jgi:hypothetical protein